MWFGGTKKDVQGGETPMKARIEKMGDHGAIMSLIRGAKQRSQTDPKYGDQKYRAVTNVAVALSIAARRGELTGKTFYAILDQVPLGTLDQLDRKSITDWGMALGLIYRTK